jgi:hypothetical protein
LILALEHGLFTVDVFSNWAGRRLMIARSELHDYSEEATNNEKGIAPRFCQFANLHGD